MKMEAMKSHRHSSHHNDQSRSPLCDEKHLGFTKLKSGRTPERQNGIEKHNGLTSSTRSPHRENGRHLFNNLPDTKVAKRRYEVGDKDIGRNETSMKNSQPEKGQRHRKRKRNLDQAEQGLDEVALKKRRRLEILEKQLRINTVPGQSADFLQLTEQHIRRASQLCTEGDFTTGNTPDNFGPTFLTDGANMNGNLVNSVIGHHPIPQIDKNLDEILSRKLKEVGCDTSPFKSGKMSAFEISLLKGKQSVERRRSLEAATLRSSPRINSNVQPPNYSDVKKQRRLSVKTDGEGSDDCFKSGSSNDRKTGNRKKKRRRHSDQSLALSPSSIENNCFVKKSRNAAIRRSSHSGFSNEGKNEKAYNGDKPPSFSYRLNGSPELKGLPNVLSLNSLSGIPKKVQGSTFSSLHRGYCANGLSGTPPALSSKPCVFDADPSDIKSSHRPDSLSVTKTTSHHHHHRGTNSEMHTFHESLPHISPTHSKDRMASSLKTSSCHSKQNRKKMSLADTVSMLHQHSKHKAAGEKLSSSKNERIPSMKVSPTKSDDGSLVSRRSSRSSTPNLSPIKSEILTPNSTPCTTPSKSPPSPGRSVMAHRWNKKKPYLFCKHDEVLTRWHDGLFYLGTILKISEKNKKCLLRYEDSSEYWSMFKDVHRVVKEEELICCKCLSEHSEPPNEIVLCDNCCQGFHQQCHTPYISSQEIVDPDTEWFCRNCVFMMTIKVQGALKQGFVADELRKMKLTLPYDLSLLTWDTQHKSNLEQCYCYCGGPGIWYQKMLQCCRCKQWYHEACLQCLEQPLLYGDSFFIFVCSSCNSGEEYIKRLDVEWPDVVHIALFNLVMDLRKKYCHIEDEIIPWIDEHWEALQLPQYAEMSGEEKAVAVKDALHENKARFTCVSEMRKKCDLWGLRIRVCPPRIHITLPIKEKVTDDIMKSLKIKGRRSKVFVPVQCQSPVQQLHHSPFNRPSAQVCKRLDNYIYKEDGTTSPAVPAQFQHQGSTVRKSNIKVPLLDRLIPPQVSFSGPDHPFKTDLEREAEISDLKTRRKIWFSLDASADCVSRSDTDLRSLTDSPPVLEKVEPVHQNCDHTPPMPQILEAKKGNRKSDKVSGSAKRQQKKMEEDEGDEDENARRRRSSSRKMSLKINAPPNITDSQPCKDVVVKRIQSVSKNCFAGYMPSGFGHFFYMNGKRRSRDGQLDYLITWET